MSSSNPLVSVILAVNRDDGFLREAIDSVLTQSLESLELIIVANRCSDELWQYLCTLVDPRIRSFRTDIGQLPFNLNFGIHHARGRYIARMDADDVCKRDRLAVQCQYLEANPDVAAVGSSYEHIDESGRFIGKPSQLRLTPKAIASRLAFESCLPHPTVMARRDALLRVGAYAYGLYAEDWDLWLRLSRAGMKLANLEQVLLSYRIHGNQSTAFSSIRRNMGNVLGLLVRELIITGRPAFFFGLLYHIVSTLFRAAVSSIRNRR